MKKHKSKKIHEVINEYNNILNLHQIKAKTGAGNGYKYHSEVVAPDNICITKTSTHKSSKIYDLLVNSTKKLNLHEIKAQTGAGNGYKH